MDGETRPIGVNTYINAKLTEEIVRNQIGAVTLKEQ